MYLHLCSQLSVLLTLSKPGDPNIYDVPADINGSDDDGVYDRVESPSKLYTLLHQYPFTIPA